MSRNRLSILRFTHKYEMPWAVQIIQNIIAVAGLIPIRLYSIDRAENIWDKLNNDKFSILNDDLEAIGRPIFEGIESLTDSKYLKLREFFKKRKNSSWTTRPSYCHPMIAEFQRFDFYRAWEQIFYYLWLVHEKKYLSKNYKVHKFLDHMIVGAKYLEVEDYKGYVVIGPVFLPPSLDTGQNFEEERVNPFFEHGSIFIDENRKENCRVLSSLRPWCSKDEILDALFQSTCALSTSLECQFPIDPDVYLRRCDCRNIAMAARALHSRSIENTILSLTQNCNNEMESSLLENLRISFFLPNDEKKYSLHASSKLIDRKWLINIKKQDNYINDENEEKIIIHFKNKNTMDYIQNVLNENTNYKEKLFEIRRFPKSTDEINSLDLEKERIKSSYLTLERRIVSTEESYAQERLSILRSSFDQELGLLSADIKEGDNQEHLKYICDRFARVVAMLLNADYCTIYIYAGSVYEIQLVGFYAGLDEDMKPNLEEYIKGLGKDVSRKKNSLTMRVIESGEAHFCCAVHRQNGQYRFIPKEESIIPELCNKIKCAINSPIKIHGRILGVIGVLGRTPYQFRYQNQKLLDRIGRIIGPYIYQTIYLSALGRLTKMAVSIDSEKKEAALYHEICREFTSIFLSYAAVLWRPSRNRKNLYYPGGWSESRKELYEILDPWHDDSYCDVNDPYSIIGEGLRKLDDSKANVFFASVSLKEIERKADINNIDWYGGKEKKNRQWFKKSNIKSITVIPIRGTQDREIIAVMVLYHRLEGMVHHWNYIVQFMAYYLALLIEVVLAQKQWEQKVQNSISHDMRQQLKLLRARCRDIIYCMPKGEEFIYLHTQGIIKQPLYKLYKVVNDIKSYSNHLDRLLMNLFENKEAFQSKKESLKFPLIIHHKVESAEDDIINLRKQFNEIFRSTWRKRKRKMIKDEYSGPHKGPYLKMPVVYLKGVLHNLVDNAVKYALKGSTISIKTEIQKYGVEFSISNEAECLREDGEEFSIFNEGYQGTNTISKLSKRNTKGGLGLYNARLYCELMDAGIYCEVEPLNLHCRFRFVVSIPKTRLIEK